MKKVIPFLFVLFLINASVYAEAKEAIAYTHLTNDYWQIWVMDPNGNNKRQVTNSPQDKRDPTWVIDLSTTKDNIKEVNTAFSLEEKGRYTGFHNVYGKEKASNGGGKIAFRTNNSQLFTVDLDGQNEEEILKKYGVITNPNFSKAANEIVFVRFDPRGKDISDIWKSDLKGENSMLLTKDKLGKFQPRFSHQGDKIAFVKADPDKLNYHIWIMNADGSNPQQLTDGKGLDTHPNFSTDQQQITFSSNRSENNFEIYNIDLETKKIKQLTHLPGLDTQSNFSSDGQKIVFVSNRSGNQQIWIMNSDGSDPAQLTSEAGESMDPAWGEVEPTKEK